LYQEPSTQKPSDATLVMITNTVKESELNLALADLAQLKEVDGEIMRIRIQTLG
jgi:homoserine dehydrogenase